MRKAMSFVELQQALVGRTVASITRINPPTMSGSQHHPVVEAIVFDDGTKILFGTRGSRDITALLIVYPFGLSQGYHIQAGY